MAKPPKDQWSDVSDPYVDWNKASAGDVASSAVSHLLPSAARDTKAAFEPFLPQNWSRDIDAAKAIATGVGSKTAGLFVSQDPAKKAKDEAGLNAVGDYYKQRYGSVAGLKQTLANDPAGVLFDVGALASIPVGGEGLAARVPGVAGKALQIAAKGARIASEVNPVSVAGKAVGITAKAARTTLQGGKILDSAGNLSAAAQAAVAKAFPSDIITPAELADPKFKAVVADTMNRKGPTPAAAKEAVLAYHDAQAPRSQVSGKAAPRPAQGTAEDMVASAKKKLGSAAQDIGGAQAPSPTELGQALESAQIGAHNDMHTLYRNAFAHPGAFDPAFAADLPTTLSASLAKDHLPSNPAEFSAYPSFVQASKAYDWITGHVNDLAKSGELTMPRLERARQELNQFARNAEGTDSRAMGNIIDAFDTHLQDQAGKGLFLGGSGPAAAADMTAARQAFKDYKGTFAGRGNPTRATVAQAVKTVAREQSIDPATGLITAPATAGSAEAAQGVIGSKLINPRSLNVPPGADQLYTHLVDAMGGAGSPGHQALNDFVKQTALASDENGLLANSDKLDRFLNSSLAPKVMTPEEMSRVRLLSAGNEVLSARPRGGLGETIGDTVGHTMRQGMGAVAGAATAHLLGGSPFEGGIAGSIVEAPIESLRGMRQRAAERAGAKPNLGPIRKIESLGSGLDAAGSHVAPLGFQADQIEALPQGQDTTAGAPAPATTPSEWDAIGDPVDDDAERVQRATGGRVDDQVEGLLKALLKRLEQAKAAQKRETKPLLKVPDEAVARALAVAQQAI